MEERDTLENDEKDSKVMLSARISSIISRITHIESKLYPDCKGRVHAALLANSLYGTRIQRVPVGYYDLSLSERAALLGCNTSQLCKSIIFENTACNHYNFTDPRNSRYYCVILQYEGNTGYIYIYQDIYIHVQYCRRNLYLEYHRIDFTNRCNT